MPRLWEHFTPTEIDFRPMLLMPESLLSPSQQKR